MAVQRQHRDARSYLQRLAYGPISSRARVSQARPRRGAASWPRVLASVSPLGCLIVVLGHFLAR
jgi:hypothetical protein